MAGCYCRFVIGLCFCLSVLGVPAEASPVFRFNTGFGGDFAPESWVPVVCELDGLTAAEHDSGGEPELVMRFPLSGSSYGVRGGDGAGRRGSPGLKDNNVYEISYRLNKFDGGRRSFYFTVPLGRSANLSFTIENGGEILAEKNLILNPRTGGRKPLYIGRGRRPEGYQGFIYRSHPEALPLSQAAYGAVSVIIGDDGSFAALSGAQRAAVEYWAAGGGTVIGLWEAGTGSRGFKAFPVGDPLEGLVEDYSYLIDTAVTGLDSAAEIRGRWRLAAAVSAAVLLTAAAVIIAGLFRRRRPDGGGVLSGTVAGPLWAALAAICGTLLVAAAGSYDGSLLSEIAVVEAAAGSDVCRTTVKTGLSGMSSKRYLIPLPGGAEALPDGRGGGIRIVRLEGSGGVSGNAAGMSGFISAYAGGGDRAEFVYFFDRYAEASGVSAGFEQPDEPDETTEAAKVAKVAGTDEAGGVRIAGRIAAARGMPALEDGAESAGISIITSFTGGDGDGGAAEVLWTDDYRDIAPVRSAAVLEEASDEAVAGFRIEADRGLYEPADGEPGGVPESPGGRGRLILSELARRGGDGAAAAAGSFTEVLAAAGFLAGDGRAYLLVFEFRSGKLADSDSGDGRCRFAGGMLPANYRGLNIVVIDLSGEPEAEDES